MKRKPEKQKKTHCCFFCRATLDDVINFYWLIPPLYLCPLCMEAKRQKNPTVWSILDVSRLILSALLFGSVFIAIVCVSGYMGDIPIEWEGMPVLDVLREWMNVIGGVLLLVLKVLLLTFLFCLLAYLPAMFLMALIEKDIVSNNLKLAHRNTYKSKYFSIMNEQAATLNYVLCGEYITKEKMFCPAWITVWLSGKMDVLCFIEGQTFMGSQNTRTTLISLQENDGIIQTTDLPLSKQRQFKSIHTQALPNADFFELAELHESQLREAGDGVKHIRKEDAVRTIDAVELQGARELVSLGIARFRNREENIISYTCKGAWGATFGHLFQANSLYKEHSDRYSIQRPSHPKYVPSNERRKYAKKDPPVITSRYTDDPNVSIDPEAVPEVIRHLVPLAMEWSIFDDVEMSEYEKSHTDEEMKAVADAVSPHFTDIENFTSKGREETPVPDEVMIFDKLAEVASGR